MEIQLLWHIIHKYMTFIKPYIVDKLCSINYQFDYWLTIAKLVICAHCVLPFNVGIIDPFYALPSKCDLSIRSCYLDNDVQWLDLHSQLEQSRLICK